MSDIFQTIKGQVNILRYMERRGGGTGKKVGSDSFHLNPCPICGHKDSCAVHPVEGYFNCFSCHTKGDVITFENAHGGTAGMVECGTTSRRVRSEREAKARHSL